MGIGVAATMAATVARPPSLALLGSQTQRHRWVLSPIGSFSSSSNPPPKPRKLVLYSKPGCCLCDGLKEKLQAAFLLSGPDSLRDVELEVRDITSNPHWEKAYQFEIPVLTRLLSDGSQETLPRLSPRLGVEQIQKKIASALRE